MTNQKKQRSDLSAQQNSENNKARDKEERMNTPEPHSRTSRHSWRERPSAGSERRQSDNTIGYPQQWDASDRRDNYGNPEDGSGNGGRP